MNTAALWVEQFMSFLIGSDPVTGALSVASLLIGIWALVARHPRLGLALLISLFGARTMSSVGYPQGHAYFAFLCYYICTTGVKKGKLYRLKHEDHEIVYCLGFLFVMRLVIAELHFFGLMNLNTLWVASVAILLPIQLLLVIGGITDGHDKPYNAMVSRFRISVNSLIFR